MIRIAEPRDAAAIAAIFAPYVRETAISFADQPPTEGDLRAKLEALLPTHPYLVLEDAGRVIAYAYASPHRALAAYRWSCEVSIYVDQGARRAGAGTRLYTALLALLREQGYQQAYAGITLPNDASARLHERFGFRFFARFENVGFKHGAWRDVGWWSFRLREPPADPPEPTAFAALRRNDSAFVSRILGCKE